MKPEPIDENDLVELIQRMGITVYGPAAEAVVALAIALQEIRDAQWEALLAAQPARPLIEAERKAAEHEYITTAFDYPSNPVGSRDWVLYWAGWLARSTSAPKKAQPAPRQELSMSMFASKADYETAKQVAQPETDDMSEGPNHLCKGRMVHLPRFEICSQCGWEGNDQ
jgi:hypothetical protein